MTWDRVERLIGSRNLEKLAQKRVGVVGLGSGGGFDQFTHGALTAIEGVQEAEPHRLAENGETAGDQDERIVGERARLFGHGGKKQTELGDCNRGVAARRRAASIGRMRA